MSKMWEKLNMSSWEDILNRHNNVIPGLLKLDDKD